jgi:DNA replication protein DnaC
MARSRVELFEQIRRDERAAGLSIRELAAKHRVHRRTVRQALASPVPPPRKVYPPRPRPAVGAYAQVIDGWLVADQGVPRKQRHTARRVWQRLVAEYGATLAEVTVSRYVARRRAELGLDRVEVSVPQAHLPGAEAEVDFGEFHAMIAGVLLKLWMFVMRLSCSGRAFHVAFATQAQEAFFEGHVLAFEYFGAVPGRVRYDNLKPAVVRVLRGRDRAEAERFVTLRSHYGFDSFFCLPGKQGEHEKGGVEGEIGRFRRRHLVPVPAVASVAALNQLISACDLVDDGRVITGRPVTIAAAFAAEQPAMLPLPAEPFDPARLLQARVDGRARVCVRQNYYSVPARYAGRRLPVRLSAASVEVLDGPQVVARHERAAGKYAEILALDHYLEVLKYKPGALPGATALVQAKAAGAFTGVHQQYWDAARRARGDAGGTRALIEVLLAHRTLPSSALRAAMAAAISSGILDPQVVVIDGRRRAGSRAAPVIPIGALARPRPSRPGPGRLRPAARPERPMTAVSDTAAQAAIGAAARELHLPTVRDQATRLAEIAARQRHTHLAYLAEVLAAELDDRSARRRARRIGEAKFPRLKRLADFNTDAVPAITPGQLAHLATGAYMDNGEPAVLLGDSGTGKTHLLIGLGLAACEQGRRVRYVTTARLVNELAEAADDRTLSRVVGRYGRLDLLLLDELGYIQIDPRGAELLFQIITEREERASIAIGTNLPFSEWGTVFPDPRLAAAILDRVTFNAHILETGTQSYRLRTSKTTRQATKPR